MKKVPDPFYFSKGQDIANEIVKKINDTEFIPSEIVEAFEKMSKRAE